MSRPQPGPGGQRQPPISYKTIPTRQRTEKWNQAKQYNYDGDDWGGFDPYDEYGGDENSQTAAEHQMPPGRVQRQQSFDTGAEARQFSAPHAPYLEGGRASPAMSSSSGGHSEDRRRREYSNPGQVPPPLQTRQSPARQTGSRKNSLTADSYANIPSNDSAASPDKPLPFIRPSDIYKRMAEEKEKERKSLDSSRPSMDSKPSMDSLNPEPPIPSDIPASQRPLSTVHERGGSTEIGSEMLPPMGSLSRLGADLAQSRDHLSEDGHAVPPTQIISNAPFSDAHNMPAGNNPNIVRDDLHRDETVQPNLRGVVRKAFDRKDTLPSSTSSNYSGEVSRSNTDSTSSISPIMSRVASGAKPGQSALERDTAVPTIAEETMPSHSRSASAQTVTPAQIQHQPVSQPEESVYATSIPPQHNTPARLPAVGSIETRRLSGPMTAEEVTSPISTANDSVVPGTVGSLHTEAEPAAREADIAATTSQMHTQIPNIAQPPQSLPSQLSAQQHTASPSLQSREPTSQDDEALPLPPRLGEQQRLNSFQPHLPGEWISAAPTPALERSEPTNVTPPPQAADKLAQPKQEHEDEEEVPDFSPDVPRRSYEQTSSVDALKNASSALGASLMSSVGLGHQTHDFASGAAHKPVEQPEMQPHRRIGELSAHRPALDREISDAPTEGSMLSEVPPTPPAKDSDKQLAASRSYANQQVTSVDTRPPPRSETLATETSNSDFESDRLRHDIVRTLGRSSTDLAEEEIDDEPRREQTALVASAPAVTTTASKGVPQIPPSETVHGTTLSDGPSANARSALPSQQATRPMLDQRFSWEMDPEVPPASLAPMAAIGELPGDKDRRSYERPPDGQGLHLTNAQPHELASPISPVSEPKGPTFDDLLGTKTATNDKLAVPGATSANRDEFTPSPVSFEESTHIPSYYGGSSEPTADTAKSQKDFPTRKENIDDSADGDADDDEEDEPKKSLPAVTSLDESRNASLPTMSSSSHGEEKDLPHRGVPIATPSSNRLPPFREILAIKETNSRIEAYNSTRHTFAEMNTGLNDWLSTMLAKHPEHSDLTNPDGSLNAQAMQADSVGRGHRHNPSFKLRQASNPFDQSQGRTTDMPPRVPAKDFAESGRQQMEKMQAKSKDFMKSASKNASVFGGKAGASAKGLLSKGMNRFGRNEKVE